MLAPNAEVSMFPWKEPKERIPLAVRQIGSSGGMLNKADYVRSIRANTQTYVSGEDTDLKVRVHGNVAVDTGLWTETLRTGTGTVTSRYRWTSVWSRRPDGRGLCVSLQTALVQQGR